MTQNKLLFNGFHKIQEVKTEHNGKIIIREKLLIKDAVAGIVTDENNRIALVTQLRPTTNHITKEIPAGVMDKDGLSFKETLIEELEEECYIKPSEILSISDEPVFDYYMIPGSSDAKIKIYDVKVTARDYTSKVNTDDNDVELIEWVDFDTLQKYKDDGLLTDPKTIIAIQYLIIQHSLIKA